MNQISALNKRCEVAVSRNWTKGLEVCEDTTKYIDEIGGGIWDFDATLFYYDWAPIEEVLISFLTSSSQKEALYKAIHIEESTKVPVFERNS